jgi:dCMP deaminase
MERYYITDWDEYFIRMSRLVALKSKDRSTGVGVVIVGPDKEVVSTGYNGFPRGMDDDLPERHERPVKYDFVVHAETNALLNAARLGVSVKGCTAYVDSSPCRDCAHNLINAGIARVVCPVNHPDYDQFAGDPNWEVKGQAAREDLIEAGVEIVEVKIPRKEILL